jgi:hypothetical protein
MRLMRTQRLQSCKHWDPCFIFTDACTAGAGAGHLWRRQGLVALDRACLGDVPAIHAAMLRVRERHPPTFT